MLDRYCFDSQAIPDCVLFFSFHFSCFIYNSTCSILIDQLICCFVLNFVARFFFLNVFYVFYYPSVLVRRAERACVRRKGSKEVYRQSLECSRRALVGSCFIGGKLNRESSGWRATSCATFKYFSRYKDSCCKQKTANRTALSSRACIIYHSS